MDPVEYALSQSVVEFLIQYAYKLLPNQNPDDNTTNNNNSDNSNINEKKSKSSSPNTENDDPSNDLKPPQPVFKLDTSDNDFDITDVTDNEDSNVDDTTNSDLDDVNFHSLNIDHNNNNNNNNNYPQTDIDSGSEFNFGHDHDHEDNFNFNHDNPGILNKLINQEEKNDAESDSLSNPPNSNVAIIVSTPSSSSVPKMK
ncbi:hypothetical protein QCA50_009858 [Cerrena zonata]|uniref:Uncharacterized protein n=1 Tax=Cerrena zonata TaxID=2478898 RepID=A0AAW0GA48_9APHY